MATGLEFHTPGGITPGPRACVARLAKALGLRLTVGFQPQGGDPPPSPPPAATATEDSFDLAPVGTIAEADRDTRSVCVKTEDGWYRTGGMHAIAVEYMPPCRVIRWGERTMTTTGGTLNQENAAEYPESRIHTESGYNESATWRG